jgi:hypothetical protein
MDHEKVQDHLTRVLRDKLDELHKDLDGSHGMKYWEPKSGNTSPRVYIKYYSGNRKPKDIGYLTIGGDYIGINVNANWHEDIIEILTDLGYEVKRV